MAQIYTLYNYLIFNKKLLRSTSCLRIPVNKNSVDCRVTVFGALAINFLAFSESFSSETMTVFFGHFAGQRINAFPPLAITISATKAITN